MKKVVSLLLAFVMCTSLCACKAFNDGFNAGLNSAPRKSVTITEENFKDYFILDVAVENFEIDKKPGISITQHRGVADLVATARLKKDVEFEDLVIEVSVLTSGMLWTGNRYTLQLQFDKDGYAEEKLNIMTDYNGLEPDRPELYPASKLSTLEDGAFEYENATIKVLGTIYE